MTTERFRGSSGTSVERRLDEAGNPVEIGFYRERLMDDDDVLAGLGDAEALRGAAAWRWASLGFAGAAAAVLLGFLVLRIVFGGDPVFEARVDGPVASAAGGAGRALGAFETRGPFPPHRVRVRAAGLPANTSVSAEIRLASAEANVDAVAGFELYHETGRDSDGFWRETRHDQSRALRLPAPARYEVFAMDVEGERTAVPPLLVTVEPNAFSFLPVVFGLAASVLGFLFCRGRAGSIVAGAVSLAHVPRARGRDHRRRPDREAGTFVDLEDGAVDVGRHGR